MNTELRKVAGNDFEKDFYELIMQCSENQWKILENIEILN